MTLGFGTYRIAQGNFAHEQALRYALDHGITVIDTSTNYTGGLSESLIGDVIQNYDRSTLTIISKFGYIQGALLDTVKTQNTLKELVPYSSDCYHDIEPAFLTTQLDASLLRLQTSYIDMYLIHNPEYYLLHHVKNPSDASYHQEQLLKRIYAAFIALEHEVQKGRIKSYGISSNSFALPKDHQHFLPYTLLIDMAKRAALEAGSTIHSFKAVQLPLNLLEQEGLACAAWAKSQGLTVIANRPLNAMRDQLMYRLANYDPHIEYERLLNETLLFLEEHHFHTIATIIQELDRVVHRFAWMGEYERFLFQSALPQLKKAFATIPQEHQATVAASIEAFLTAYEQQVAYEASKKTKASLKALGVIVQEPLQKAALDFLVNTSDVDIVLIGMRKIKYVQDALATVKYL